MNSNELAFQEAIKEKSSDILEAAETLIQLSNQNNDVNTLNNNNLNENIIKTLHLSGHNHRSFAFNSADIANRGWLQTIIDSSHLITFCISISVIIYGSFRSLNIDKENNEHQNNSNNNCEQNESLLSPNSNNDNSKNNNNQSTQQQSVQTINSTQALFIPVAASISLLVMFFFFDSIQTAFVICTSVLATVAFSFLLSPVCRTIIKSCAPKYLANQILNKKVSCCFIGKFTSPELLAFLISSFIVGLWIVTGHWLLMDLIGVGFCVTFIAIVRLPSLKVSTLLLVGLVIYDVLWVYFSHLIFSSNVMVKVATKEADNPVGLLARKLNIDSSFSNNSPKLSLPGKLIVPSVQRTGNFSILGLGDIVIPGLLLCFVLRFDAYKRSQLLAYVNNGDKNDDKNSTNNTNQKCTSAVNCECLDCKLNDHKNIHNERFNKNFLNGSNDLNEHSYPFLFNSHYQQFNSNKNSDNTNCNDYRFKNKYSIVNLIKLNKMTYFHCSLIGYFVGLITATLSSEIFREAQPALLYLVPFTLLPLLTMAYLKGDLRMMWNDPFVYTTPKYFYV